MKYSDYPIAGEPSTYVKNGLWPLSLDLLYDKLRAGEVRAVKVGNKWVVTRESLREFFGDPPELGSGDHLPAIAESQVLSPDASPTAGMEGADV